MPRIAIGGRRDTNVVWSTNAFALDLFHQVASTDNPFLSPTRIGAALSMTWLGARGDTAKVMGQTLKQVDPALDVALAWKRWTAVLEAGAQVEGSGYQVVLANRLFGARSVRFRPEFLGQVTDGFGAPLEPVDFAGDPEASGKHINRWVEGRTHDRIQELLTPGQIDSSTRLVLANAIGFKGEWRLQFEEKLTREGAFTRADGSHVIATLMHQTASQGAGEIPGGVVAALPYGKSQRLRLLIVAPNPPHGIAGFSKGLNAKKLRQWTVALGQRMVDMTLPRFKSVSRIKLKNVLIALGMGNAFGGGADFSGMSGDRSLFISDAVHKAFVEVDEKGAEAAAATAVVLMRGTASADPPPNRLALRADRPFFYFILDQVSGAVLFMGRMDDPSRPA